MTRRVVYHHLTTDLALFETNGRFWIGSYFAPATHQNGEPPYVLIDGYFDTEDQGRARLAEMVGSEF